MRDGGRLQAAIEILSDIETRRRPASDALKDWGLDHRFAGSGDRSAIGNLVRDALRRRRFPRLTALEQEYAAALKRLKSPQGVHLTADRYFEDDALTATFRFASRDQLAAVADELRQLAAQPELETLLRLIQGQSQ